MPEFEHALTLYGYEETASVRFEGSLSDIEVMHKWRKDNQVFPLKGSYYTGPKRINRLEASTEIFVDDGVYAIEDAKKMNEFVLATFFIHEQVKHDS